MLKHPRVAAVAGITGLALVILVTIALAPWSSGDSGAQTLRQGDANCDQVVDARDALAVLRVAANVPPFAPCAAQTGDVDCSDAVDATDAIDIVMYAAGLPVPTGQGALSVEGACPPIGTQLDTPTSSPTATATPTPTVTTPVSPTPTLSSGPTDCTGPGGGPSLPSAPAPTSPPAPDAYGATQVLSTSYLGDAANEAVEFALIPGRPNEAVIAVQSGYIYHVFLDGSGETTLWGDIHSLVTHNLYDEQGLLSVAFSPNYQQDSRVYLYYTPGAPSDTVLARFHATPDGGLDESSEEVLIQVQEFATNHNGGQIVFDSAGYLYFGVGDGGGGGDPQERGQALDTLLGKISRIDVSGESGYEIPRSNPCAGAGARCTTPRSPSDTSACPEIFAYGFRNPFRMSIDPVSGQLWAGDVGQDLWEEVDHVTLGGNYGWSVCEGNHIYPPQNPDVPCTGPYVLPRAEYDHGGGRQDVIGGAIYHGSAMPELEGWFVYADFASGDLYAVDTASSAPPVHLGKLDINVSNFVTAPTGEIFMLAYGEPFGPGGLYRLSR
jgi:glucose/arabinose dehydrogenase